MSDAQKFTEELWNMDIECIQEIHMSDVFNSYSKKKKKLFRSIYVLFECVPGVQDLISYSDYHIIIKNGYNIYNPNTNTLINIFFTPINKSFNKKIRLKLLNHK
jgi:hypothetical protein